MVGMPLDIPWGKEVSGRLVVKCDVCGSVWTLVVDKVVISEGVGERCPSCNKVTTNWVKTYAPKGVATLESFFR